MCLSRIFVAEWEDGNGSGSSLQKVPRKQISTQKKKEREGETCQWELEGLKHGCYKRKEQSHERT